MLGEQPQIGIGCGQRLLQLWQVVRHILQQLTTQLDRIGLQRLPFRLLRGAELELLRAGRLREARRAGAGVDGANAESGPQQQRANHGSFHGFLLLDGISVGGVRLGVAIAQNGHHR